MTITWITEWVAHLLLLSSLFLLFIYGWQQKRIRLIDLIVLLLSDIEVNLYPFMMQLYLPWEFRSISSKNVKTLIRVKQMVSTNVI